jgi:hypothetical protein
MRYRLRTLLLHAAITAALAAFIWFGVPLFIGERPPLALIALILVVGLTSAVTTSRTAR